MSQNCGSCFYWLKPTRRMIQGQCQYWQFMARQDGGGAPFWTQLEMMPIAWKSALEGSACKAWDVRDFDIAELALPGPTPEPTP